MSLDTDIYTDTNERGIFKSQNNLQSMTPSDHLTHHTTKASRALRLRPFILQAVAFALLYLSVAASLSLVDREKERIECLAEIERIQSGN